MKELVLKKVEEAVAEGFSQAWVCSLWGVSDDRVHRWRQRLSATGTLIDQAPGGSPTLVSETPHAELTGDAATSTDFCAKQVRRTAQLHRGSLTAGSGAPLCRRRGQDVQYVTPNDEHEGRGDAIREARRRSLERVRQERLAYHRRDTTSTGEPGQ